MHPLVTPPDSGLAAAHLLEWFGHEKAWEVALGYFEGRVEAGDLESAAAWCQVLEAIEVAEEMGRAG